MLHLGRPERCAAASYLATYLSGVAALPDDSCL
eukprot:COSAG05_NODE_16806_length_338_cov_0.861925_1_plen_32_part_10